MAACRNGEEEPEMNGLRRNGGDNLIAQLGVQASWDLWSDLLSQSNQDIGTRKRQGAHRREERLCGADLIECFLLPWSSCDQWFIKTPRTMFAEKASRTLGFEEICCGRMPRCTQLFATTFVQCHIILWPKQPSLCF